MSVEHIDSVYHYETILTLDNILYSIAYFVQYL